ncbi:SafA/ExsA family spore coat assembly protein [Calidifontibacillus erzurumensis]|uniref:SafA/ExsA family spore coat assembly protein n=1 Tax=Calidifontibacillus erzurumensis TaxID=2741433 RepID=UPI002E780341|nr:SafA/ExsA family spore coat assembly protein [Calidifontibacillus erzurumensis]
MKIHIVQKGDTLWKIAQKYGVDFNELKQVNSHLSNPDMIMPGMKIKIPTGSVPVKKKEIPGHEQKEIPIVKETPKEVPKEIPKEIPKEMPKEAPQPVQPTPPPVMQVPKFIPIPQPVKQPEIDYNIEQNMYNYTFNIPTYPTIPLPKKEKVKEAPKLVEKEEKPVEEPQAPPAMPMPQPYSPCVPVTGLLPGSGLPFGYPGSIPCPPPPCPPHWGIQPFAGVGPMMPGTYGGTPTPDAAVAGQMTDNEDDVDEVTAQMYPGLSTSSGADSSDCGCSGPKMTMPTAYSPEVQPPMGTAPMGADTWQGAELGMKPATKADCGCGSGSMPMGYYGAPVSTPAGYGAVPTGYYGSPAGTPAGYGAVPTGYYGSPAGAPAGYGAVPTGYYGAPVGTPAGYGVMPTGYYGAPVGTPAGYGAMPMGYYGTPTGYYSPFGSELGYGMQGMFGDAAGMPTRFENTQPEFREDSSQANIGPDSGTQDDELEDDNDDANW